MRCAGRTAEAMGRLADDGRTVSYGELRDTMDRFATFLRERGLGPNDRVALLANNSVEQLLCYFGVMASGATVCTIHVEMNRNQLGNIFTRLEPKLIFYQDGLQLDDLLAEASAPRIRIGRYGQFEPDTLFAELSRISPAIIRTWPGRRMTRLFCSHQVPAPSPRASF